MLTKITRNPFPKVESSSKILNFIYSDVCELHGTPTLGGKNYSVTFIDDYTRYCHVYLLHSKDEAKQNSRHTNQKLNFIVKPLLNV